MTEKNKQQETSSSSPDLSVLAEFQFGPSWARQGVKKDYPARSFPERMGRDESRGRRGGKFSQKNRQGREFSDRKRDGRFNKQYDDKRGGRMDRNRERSPLPEPAEGLRVELRPVDNGLAACVAEVNKHKRVVSLFDFAKIVMSRRDRYDLVFMKQEGGPQLICSKRDDNACWLTKNEALAYIWKSPWLSEYYDSVEEEVEPPKGVFTAIGKCSLSGELVGPVNWHGYQSALVNLHRTRFSNMDFDHFKTKIHIEKGDEAVQAWTEAVSKKIVWKPKRTDCEEVVLADTSSVEKDFEEHHFDEVYSITDKVFINGAVSKRIVSPGLWAHIVQLSDVTRKHPSMLIPNLCHGLARHHMPIFKWKGGHHTGPSRPRSLPEDTVLADRMLGIVSWVTENAGKRVDAMLNELCGEMVEEPQIAGAEQQAEEIVEETPVSVEAAEENNQEEKQAGEDKADNAITDEINTKRQELVKDLFWLCDQGYVLVFANGRINLPQTGKKQNGEQTAGEKKKPVAKAGKKSGKTAAPKKESSTPKSENDKPVADSVACPVTTGEQNEPPAVEKTDADIADNSVEKVEQ